MKKTMFDKSYTLYMKGVGIILMIFHHLFYNQELMDKFTLLIPSLNSVFLLLSKFSKVCVSIFLLLSGFGLTKSFANESKIINKAKFVLKHLLKLIKDYWWCVLPFMIIGTSTGIRSFELVYGTPYILRCITDLLGMNYLLYGFNYLYNDTCWFLSVAICMYLLFPFLNYVLSRRPYIFIAIILLLMYLPMPKIILRITEWILPFAIGMVLAKYNQLDVFIQEVYKNNYRVMIMSFVFMLFAAYIRDKFPITTDGIFALSIIMVMIIVRKYISILESLMKLLGRYSSTIFMIHTFFFESMFPNIVYIFKYPILTMLWLIFICLIYSILLKTIRSYLDKEIESIKKLCR